ncbi:sn-glycerol-3-phosphate ABC transporter ATP-binding protein UgpC [Roseibium porphyridii]|uniref:Sn-glycerol-3-phosphate ABC transporter ATP-binding protein UgpC n=1 Tax=Roseibium porphyridii TaxID=2866279 RepID=A0ABY8F310_9HYPH|nr:sn-glycerol-3-phosphate ABC transporter ATP-binding protein UgpC [Roseibium sp. KMA01]WFE89873.1 sn-glycerol-3-phosphate ABC transporter ATP-binding protein UgpC [Roseibium sp. KMA01]
MASIAIQDVRKSYGPLEVIHGVSLDIDDGEFVILVGPSGCGKSTLLRMIAGLENISEGQVAVNGSVINHLPPRARDIAMVFQSYALYPHMTVSKNMGFSLKLAGVPKREIDEKVLSAAEVLDLKHLLDRKPGQLSGGQRQRVAMGRAIVRNPKLFLFDEPLSNLDAKLRVQMRSEIKELHQQLSTTTVYVTHDQVEAMTMADRIVVMNSGHIEQTGTPMELYDKPLTRFVASFIGSPAMNMIEGKLLPQGRFATTSGTIIDVAKFSPQDAWGQDVVLGIRPEHISIGQDGVALGDAHIRVVEPTGSETLLFVDALSQPMHVLDRTRCVFNSHDVVPLSATGDDFHFFSSATGKRLNDKR